MAKPSVVPTWATDTNYAVGGEAGTVTKATPSAAQLAQGGQASATLQLLHLNYWLNIAGTWFTWVDGILAEALTWTGAAIFTPSVATTNGVTATGNTTGSGVKGTGGATNGLGCEGVGTATGSGVKGTGGATSGKGVEGIGTAGGSGVKGTGGATDGIGCEGVGTAAGPGMKCTGGATGYGLEVVGTAARANIILGTTGGAPSTLANGTIWYDGTDIWCRAGGSSFKLNA